MERLGQDLWPRWFRRITSGTTKNSLDQSHRPIMPNLFGSANSFRLQVGMIALDWLLVPPISKSCYPTVGQKRIPSRFGPTEKTSKKHDAPRKETDVPSEEILPGDASCTGRLRYDIVLWTAVHARQKETRRATIVLKT